MGQATKYVLFINHPSHCQGFHLIVSPLSQVEKKPLNSKSKPSEVQPQPKLVSDSGSSIKHKAVTSNKKPSPLGKTHESKAMDVGDIGSASITKSKMSEEKLKTNIDSSVIEESNNIDTNTNAPDYSVDLNSGSYLCFIQLSFFIHFKHIFAGFLFMKALLPR